MPSLWFRKARKCWMYDFVDQAGKRHSVRVGKSKREALAAVREIEARAGEAVASAMTIAVAAEQWLQEREADPDLRATRYERGHVRNHIAPEFGDLPIGELTRGQVSRWAKRLRTEKGLEPKTVINIHGTLHGLYAWLELDQELVTSNPVTLGRGRLPRPSAADKRRHRQKQTFTREEVETLISNPAIPLDRRMLYGLTFFTGARRAEAVVIRFEHYDERAQPLGQITVCETYEGGMRTKTDVVRLVPVHPTLAAMIAEWKLLGFQEFTKRRPRPGDPIVPKRDGLARSPWWVWGML